MKRIRQSLIDSTRAFVLEMLSEKQRTDAALVEQVTEKVLKALPSSVRYG
jgi:hypothetical protein